MAKIIKGPWEDGETKPEQPETPEKGMPYTFVPLHVSIDFFALFEQHRTELREANSIIPKQKLALKILIREILKENSTYKGFDIAQEAVNIYTNTHGYDPNGAWTFRRHSTINITPYL